MKRKTKLITNEKKKQKNKKQIGQWTQIPSFYLREIIPQASAEAKV